MAHSLGWRARRRALAWREQARCFGWVTLSSRAWARPCAALGNEQSRGATAHEETTLGDQCSTGGAGATETRVRRQETIPEMRARCCSRVHLLLLRGGGGD